MPSSSQRAAPTRSPVKKSSRARAGPTSWVANYRAAVTHALLGNPARALALLERALDLGASVSEAAQDDDLAVLRDLPEYRELLERSTVDRRKEEDDAS